MRQVRIGVAAMGGDARQVVARIQELERRGIDAAWLTQGGTALDSLSVLAVAAASTERIRLGASVVATWPRHPIVTVQQAQVIASFAPGRLRLGLGPSHRTRMEGVYGFSFREPLTDLREYLHVVRTLLHEGSVDFDGRHYHAHASIPAPAPDLPVMAAALRRRSYELCGEAADGAISWVSPPAYLRDVALPAIQVGAERAGRAAPPLIVHVPLCVSEDVQAVRQAVRTHFAYYPKLPFYAGMFAEAGFPEARETGEWSDRMVDAVAVSGDEARVGARLTELFQWGVAEIIAQVFPIGRDDRDSWGRSVTTLAELAKHL